MDTHRYVLGRREKMRAPTHIHTHPPVKLPCVNEKSRESCCLVIDPGKGGSDLIGSAGSNLCANAKQRGSASEFLPETNQKTDQVLKGSDGRDVFDFGTCVV